MPPPASLRHPHVQRLAGSMPRLLAAAEAGGERVAASSRGSEESILSAVLDLPELGYD